MTWSPSTRLREAQEECVHRSIEANERIKRAIETHLNFEVEEDILQRWLPELVLKQKLSTDEVTVNNKWWAGWSQKNSDPLYLKALNHKLGLGFSARVRVTRFLLRPYIEVSWTPVQSGSA